MSQENVEIVRMAFDAVDRRDVEAFSELLHEEVTWRPFFSVETDLLVGKEAVREAWDSYVVAIGLRPQLDECIEAGDGRVVVRLRYLARGTRSGLALEAPAGQIYAFKNGRIANLETYQSFDAALEAAGLSE